MPFDHLQLEQHERVLVVRLGNPPLNFLTSAMMQELELLLDQLEAHDGVGAVILTSALPGVFLTHFDVDEIKAMATGMPAAFPAGITRAVARTEAALSHVPGARKLLASTPAAGVSSMNLFHEVCARMRAMNKVFIAAINGRAMGGGCELTLACDLRLMADGTLESGAIIGQPEIYIGLIPGGGGTQMLTRALGTARALELCLEGSLLTPKEALAIGLVNRVVPAEKLMDEAMTMAMRLARRSPDAIHAIKRAVYEAASMPLAVGLEIEKSEFMSVATQEDTRHAMATYADFVSGIVAEGRDIGIEDFARWIDGTAVDFGR